jgi:hypothetical protein
MYYIKNLVFATLEEAKEYQKQNGGVIHHKGV